MRYGVLFNEEESQKLEELLVYCETKDMKSLLTDAINVMYAAFIGNNND